MYLKKRFTSKNPYYTLRVSLLSVCFSLLSSPSFATPSSSTKPGNQKASTWVQSEGTIPSSWARSALLGTTSSMGLGIYAPTVIVTAEGDSLAGEGGGDVGVGTLGLAFSVLIGSYLIPAFTYDEDEVTWAMTDLAVAGFSRGLYHGGLLNVLAYDSNADPSLSTFAIFPSLLSIAEGATGLYFAKKYKWTAGYTHTLTVSHDLVSAGSIFGFLALVDATESDLSGKGFVSMVLGSSILGVAGGHFYSKYRSHSWGDAEFVRLSSVLGMGAILPTLSHLDYLSSQSLAGPFGLLLGGLIGGAWLGDYLVKDIDLRPMDAVLMDIATVGGYLGGLFIPAALASEEPAILWGGALGAALGYGLSYSYFSKVSKSSSTSASLGQEPAYKAALSPWITPSQVKLGEMNRGLAFTLQF